MKFAYYNEFDPKAAAWIKQLIKNGLIADGEVDERSITEVTADEIRGFTQHHFFAGIGGWSYSLRLAGWADDRPVCTASLPCQPFSVAGAQKGVDDDRHLLPHFIELVKHCNFQTIFGEQVPGAIKHGWLDDLCTEMEREKYAVGSIVLTAAGAGAPHIRQRLYWVADSIDKGSQGRLSGWQDQEREIVSGHAGCSGTVGGLSNPENGYGGGEPQLATSNVGESWDKLGRDGSCSGMGNTEHAGQFTSKESRSDATPIRHSKTGANSTSESEGTSTSRIISEWTDPDWIYCRDEKYRPVKSSIEPLANGLPRGMGYSSYPSEPIEPDNTQEARVMRLKGYGNAIVPQVAASFIKAFLEI
jgi:DNA (cytosine-5)-methyltransferase 1